MTATLALILLAIILAVGMAGTDGATELRTTGNTACAKPKSQPAVKYARICGEEDGQGPKEAEAFQALVEAEGKGRAKSIKALSLFLMWGSLTGNTVNCAKKRLIGLAPFCGLSFFSLIFFCYYGPLFFLVFVVNTMLKCFPRMSKQVWFFKLMGVTLWFLAGLWIWPVGLLGLVVSPCCKPSYTAKSRPAKSKQSAVVAPSDGLAGAPAA